MLTFSGSLKVFVAVEPCDMRKGFNGLHAMASERLGEDPRQGALFVAGSEQSFSTSQDESSQKLRQAGRRSSVETSL